MAAKGIRRRGDSWLVDVTRKGRRLTATCASFDEAEVKRAELMAALLREGSEPAGRAVGMKQKGWTLGEAYDHVFTHVWQGSRAERTAVVNAQSALAHFGRARALDEIDTLALQQWVAKLKAERKSNGTINRKLSSVSKIMTEAVRARKLAARPYIPKVREPEGRIRYLSDDEERVLLKVLKQHNKDLEAEMVEVLIDTGLRISEFLSLEPRDVDLSV